MIGPDVKYQRAKRFSDGTEYEIFRYNYCDNGCIFHKERGDGFPAFLEYGGCPIEDGLEDGRFDNSIFTMNRPEGDFAKAYEAKKNIQDYIFTDSQIERRFVEDLDGAEEVIVYSKLPDGKGGFYIPTPMGEYTPDWAIAFDKDKVRHIFFVAETKGSMSTMDLSKIEENKIKCARKLFENSGIKVSFGTVNSYANLLDLVRGA